MTVGGQDFFTILPDLLSLAKGTFFVEMVPMNVAAESEQLAGIDPSKKNHANEAGTC